MLDSQFGVDGDVDSELLSCDLWSIRWIFYSADFKPNIFQTTDLDVLFVNMNIISPT